MQKAFYIIAGTNNYKAIARDPLPSKSFLNKSQEGCTVLKLWIYCVKREAFLKI